MKEHTLQSLKERRNLKLSI